MTIRSRCASVVFQHDFHIEGINRRLPPGAYDVVTDEEEIEGLSFLAYRRVATSFRVTGPTRERVTTESFSVDPVDLEEALRQDAAI
ncbi:MAG: hypothetical protein WBB98_03430 [Xanthobacteraceae bacterium]|jgi:hypothetical protein